MYSAMFDGAETLIAAANAAVERRRALADPDDRHPMLGILILARIARNRARADAAAAVGQVAHAVAEANRIGDHDLAGRALIADLQPSLARWSCRR